MSMDLCLEAIIEHSGGIAYTGFSEIFNLYWAPNPVAYTLVKSSNIKKDYLKYVEDQVGPENQGYYLTHKNRLEEFLIKHKNHHIFWYVM